MAESRLTPGQSPLHQFGAEVRSARKEAALTGEQLAGLVPCDKSTVSRIETGRLHPDLRFAQACDNAFPKRVGWFVKFFHEHGWGTGSPAFRPWREIEAQATALRWWSPGVWPGLLQAPGYVREIMTWVRATESAAEEVVNERIERQEQLLYRPDPVRLHAVIDESVLHNQARRPGVMAEALAHAVKATELPHVIVQVVPRGLAPHIAEFAIARTGNADIAAYLETAAGPRTERAAALIEKLANLFEILASSALPIGASLDLMTEALERCQGQ